MICVTQQGIQAQREMLARAALEKGFKPYTTEGHAADSPQNGDRPAVDSDEAAVGHPGPLGEQREVPDEAERADPEPEGTRKTAPGRHPVTGQFRSEVAAGHGITGDGRMDYQPPMTPVHLTDLATVRGGQGALCSAIDEHQGAVRVQGLDAATASWPGMAGQLGRNAPSGVPGQPAPFTAPDRPGGQFRVSPPRAMGGF
jgi:hypothetical protein